MNTEAGLEGEESNIFHIKSIAIKMLSCKNFAILLDPSLEWMYFKGKCYNKTWENSAFYIKILIK